MLRMSKAVIILILIMCLLRRMVHLALGFLSTLTSKASLVLSTAFNKHHLREPLTKGAKQGLKSDPEACQGQSGLSVHAVPGCQPWWTQEVGRSSLISRAMAAQPTTHFWTVLLCLRHSHFSRALCCFARFASALQSVAIVSVHFNPAWGLKPL